MQTMSIASSAVLAGAFWCSSASGALVTQTYDFTFDGFVSSFVGTGTPPFDPVTGSITITFDPTLAYGQQYVSYVTDGLVLNSLSIPLDSPLGFNYDPTLQRLNLGGIEDGVDAITQSLENPQNNDLWFNFRGVASGSPTFQEMSYTTAGIVDFFYSRRGQIVVVTTSVVPEPASILLLALGIAALAGTRAGRRRQLV